MPQEAIANLKAASALKTASNNWKAVMSFVLLISDNNSSTSFVSFKCTPS